MQDCKVDVVIPVYKPQEQFLDLLERLRKQTVEINRIILINTEKKYFDEEIFCISKNIEVIHIHKEEFDHAATRDMGMNLSDADYVLFMTMDAMPADEKLIEKLLEGFEEENVRVAVTYARQLPSKTCRLQEKYTRKFNYPKYDILKTRDKISDMGIKTYFCSDVCAMYDRQIYAANGGFCEQAIFNEDMIYAAKVINSGFGVKYCASAKVIHSHNYSCMEQFRRNFDMGVSQAEHPEVFRDISSESEGRKLVIGTMKYLFKKGHWYEIPYLFVSSVFKLAGYKKGLKYRKMKPSAILKYTSNREYWKFETKN